MDGIPPCLGRCADGSSRSSEAPVRMAVLFSGNGFHSREWWARGEGESMELGKVLEPLSDFRRKLVFIRGLYNQEALKGNIHSSQTGNLLSGAPRRRAVKSDLEPVSISWWRSVWGIPPRSPSLVLGCEKSNPSVHKNYSMLYSSHISWSSPHAP